MIRGIIYEKYKTFRRNVGIPRSFFLEFELPFN